MWLVENQTPFAIDGAFLRDRDAREVWVIAIRASFRVDPRERLIRLADQQGPLLAPLHLGEPGKSSLRYDTDFALRPPATDIVVHGIAYAPGGRPAPAVDVAVRVDGRTKALRVHGPRTWGKRVGAVLPGSAQPFAQLPITYELAYGGPDPLGPKAKVPQLFAANPVGRGFAHDPGLLVGQPASSVETVDQPARAGVFDIAAAGFGPIDRSWSPRIADAGTYDQAWQDQRAPLLPTNYNERFSRQAPADQRLERVLQPGEQIQTLNLVPFGRLTIVVPSVEFSVKTVFSDGDATSRATLDTVAFESEGCTVRFVWRAALECHGREDRLLRSVVHWQGQKTWGNE